VVDETAIGGQAREFPPTRWTLILSSRDGDSQRTRALDELLATYWKPLYFYVRRKGQSIDGAKDAVQGLFAQLLERDFLARLDPARGRFRGFLKTAADHYLANQHEAAVALKRGGAVRTVALDFELAERDLAAAPAAAEEAFDREWAGGVMQRAMDALRREFADGTRRGPLDLALRFFNGGVAPTYEQAAKDASMSVVRFKAFLHRARTRFRELLRAEVAHTLQDAKEADAEISALLQRLRA
jgi:RNA polymerase sigma-70 factor (ECF subfamily)